MPFWRSHERDVAATPPSRDESALVAALRARDEQAFVTLVERDQGPLMRLALMHVRDRAVAEEVVQETWLGVLRGIDRFEGRSTLRTWITRILLNTARTRAEKEARTVSFSDVSGATADDFEPAVEAPAFDPVTHMWAAAPDGWDGVPEARLLSKETRSRIDAAIEALPPNQREVITLRDVEGWGPGEVCNALDLSESNQRVLLHRARAKVRQALVGYLEGTEA